MEIEQAREEKAKLEKEIVEAAKRFSEKTSLIVERIELDYLRFGHSDDSTTYTAEAVVEL